MAGDLIVKEDPWLTSREVADRLRVSVETLRYWRKRREGPYGVLMGNHVKYRLSSVESYERECERAEAARRSA
jgi:hypothetical protein